MVIKDFIYEKFNNGEFEGVGIKRICALLGAKSRAEKNTVIKAVSDLENEGVIVYDNGRFILFENSKFYKGVVRANERGFAFVVTEKDGDFFIPPRCVNGALNGDTVVIEKIKYPKGSSDEAQIIKILTRKNEKVVGTFDGDNGYGFVIPDDKNLCVDVYIPVKKTMGAKKGDKVVAVITEYPEKRRNPEGKIVEILGRKFDLRAEELSIIKSYDYELDFNEKVLKEVEKVPSFVSESELVGRVDYTNDFIVTIDGEDSRDFDDAVSVKKYKNYYELGVHIADVSHYVNFNSAIGKEAFNRSTSVYFPERVIPMLPKKLSNGICSLNENELRLTLSVIMKINFSGEVIGFDITKGYIRSKKRLTYTEVQAVIDGEETTLNKEIVSNILLMRELQLVLTEKRNARGNIDLDVKESHISVSEKGEIIVEQRSSKQAYKVIEEFMIITNETVAEYIFYMNLPFIYRVHEKPAPEKTETFKNFLKVLGITVKWNAETCHPKDYQTLLDLVREQPIFSVVNKVMLRSMQKAKYSPENIGHFGLSSKCYSHFTSPIRRLPDLVIHKIIKDVLDGKDVTKKYSSLVTEASNISSTNERKADEAERSMDDFYKCRYMKKFIGCEFDGVISGVTNFGVFVELENTVEGLVKVEKLPRGNYQYDEKTFALRSGKRSYALGDRVKVVVLGVDSRALKIDMQITVDKFSKSC